MIKELNNLIDNLNELKEQEKNLLNQIKSLSNQIKEKDLNSFSYGEIKKLKKEIQFFLTPENEKMINGILKNKKAEIYPELKNPTYIPEIDALPVSDSEKLRLDNAAKNAIRYYISEENCKKLQDPLTIEDLDLLSSIGVAEKVYAIFCKHCGSRQKLL